jgi:hypothetical protein
MTMRTNAKEEKNEKLEEKEGNCGAKENNKI